FSWSAPCSYHTGIRSYVNLIRLSKARTTYSSCLIHIQPNLVATHTSDDCAPWPKSAAILHSSSTVHEKQGIEADVNFVSALQSAQKMVDVRGFEPLTPRLQRRQRKPNKCCIWCRLAQRL